MQLRTCKTEAVHAKVFSIPQEFEWTVQRTEEPEKQHPRGCRVGYEGLSTHACTHPALLLLGLALRAQDPCLTLILDTQRP